MLRPYLNTEFSGIRMLEPILIKISPFSETIFTNLERYEA